MADAHRFHLHHPADLNNKTKQSAVKSSHKLPVDILVRSVYITWWCTQSRLWSKQHVCLYASMLLPLGIGTYLCHRFLLSQWHGPAVNKVKHTLTSLQILLHVYWSGPQGKKTLIFSVLCFHSYSFSRWVEQDGMQWFQLFMLVLTFRSCSWSNVKSLTGTSISSRDVLSFFCQDDGRNYIV